MRNRAIASIDGSYYFLTVLAPIRNAAKGGTVSQATAPMISLRDLLAKTPTAMQSPASAARGKNSPFSRSTMTHFTRLSIISQLGFNGTQAGDPLLSKIGFAETRVRHDDLENHYLMWACEFDAASGSPERDLAVYLRDLWDVMGKELRAIFGHCVGFDDVDTAAKFITYIKACEIDTTLPFNYYWAEEPDLPSLTTGKLGAKLALATAAAGGGLWAALHFLAGAPQWLSITLGIVAAIIAAVWAFAAILRHAGDKPFPRSDADLPTILKSMHIQTKLSAFAVANQSAPPEELHRLFGEFLADVRPSEPTPHHPAGQVFVTENDQQESA